VEDFIDVSLWSAPIFDAKLGRVTISASRWFETVSNVGWNFYVGGYQPAQKWLKDRSAHGGTKPSPGCVLTPADILHYRRMIVHRRPSLALAHTWCR
jgi:hypothetical protein